MPNHLLALICIIVCSLCNYNNNNNHKSADETILLNGVFNEADKDSKKSTIEVEDSFDDKNFSF